MSARNYFAEKLKVERDAWDAVVAWLTGLGFKVTDDVRDDPDFREGDIDLIMEDDGVPWTAEVKVRSTLYGDLALETLSCKEKGTPGFLFKSKANLLVYVFYVGGQIHPKSAVLVLNSLRTWFRRNRGRYRGKLAPNPPGDPFYHSVFYPVPFRDLPRFVYYPKGPLC